MKNPSDQSAPTPPAPAFLVGEIARNIHSRIRRESDRLGLKLGFRHILFQLASGGDGCPQHELVRQTHLSAPTVSVTLSQMEQLGLINRIVDKKDMRLVHIHLTDKGRAMHDDMRGIVKNAEEAAVAGFSEEELAMLTAFLRRIRNNLGYEENALVEAD